LSTADTTASETAFWRGIIFGASLRDPGDVLSGFSDDSDRSDISPHQLICDSVPDRNSVIDVEAREMSFIKVVLDCDSPVDEPSAEVKSAFRPY
jgi:hypothetical protein